MRVKIQKKKNLIDYESEILEFIKEKPDGVTITDITEQKNFSRNTVSKYVAILGFKKKIFSRKVGAYKLYFNAEQDTFSKLFSIAFYKGILTGLKQKFPNSKEIFKDIGRICYDNLDFSIGQMISKELSGFKVNRLIKLYYEVFGKFYPSYGVVQPRIEISVDKLANDKSKTMLKFRDSEFLGTTDDYIYHVYIIIGLIEELWKKEVGKSIKCDVEEIHIADKKEDSFYKLSIQFD